MKTRDQIEKKILELTKKLKGSEGSKAHRIRGEMEILNWVLE